MILQSESDFEWVGEAGTGEDLLTALENADPAVVLMDIPMPGMGGVETLRRVRDVAPEVAVVMLTTFDDEELVVAAVRSGARGYLLKDAGRVEILRTIRAAARGEHLRKAASGNAHRRGGLGHPASIALGAGSP